MKAIVVTDQAAGTAGMTLVERPEPQAAINDVVVRVHATGFVPTELTWPSTWTDRRDHDRTPSIPGHELAGVVTALGYGTTGLSVGQRMFGLGSAAGPRRRGGRVSPRIAPRIHNPSPFVQTHGSRRLPGLWPADLRRRACKIRPLMSEGGRRWKATSGTIRQ